ncbi:hypothetical protein BU25DRAFT_343657 [Macroventuria anomochaeta]|uniref:Uncharacterized protein n=1 Tax=Macroventuria anomochaeta TaxID=301207 RepID=A0ACB6RYF0_9PLEO|nr:uncharacterized protein BU25DRAFT_343657 [Macroventuria anomochaeta]KAF2626440.1 hypothetical protein BU25DRAFT_343657 [Macroventuria anomochaeta]
MQLITVLSVATSMIATATANVRSAVELNSECNASEPMARIHNRCSYDVHLWSVYKGDGCPTDEMVTLKTGETYRENYANAQGGSVGVSIKISKSQQCKGNDITQLEYFIQRDSPGFNFNYLDVSYVDCPSDTADCPTRQEGYYLVAGDQTGFTKASSDNSWCPVMSCNDPASCNKISYVLADDVQTKTCDPGQSMDFYMCGGEAPGESASSASSAAPKSSAAPSTKKASSSTAQATSSAAASSTEDSYETEFKVAAAAVTPAPEAEQVNNQKTKTEVVYVTAYETINAKRHAHGHGRRHQPFHA